MEYKQQFNIESYQIAQCLFYFLIGNPDLSDENYHYCMILLRRISDTPAYQSLIMAVEHYLAVNEYFRG